MSPETRFRLWKLCVVGMIVCPGLVFLLEGWPYRFAAAAAGQVSVLSFVGWLLMTTPADAIKLKPGTSLWVIAALCGWAGYCFGGLEMVVLGIAAFGLANGLMKQQRTSSPWWVVIWIAHPACSASIHRLGVDTMYVIPLVVLVIGGVAALLKVLRRDPVGDRALGFVRPLWLMASMLVVVLLRP